MKKLLALLLALTMVFALAACGGGNAPAATQAPAAEVPAEAPAEEPAAGPVTINFWSMWNDGEPQATVIAEAAEAYEAATGNTVNIEWKGRDINTLLSSSLEAGEAIDIFEDDFNRIGQVYAPYTYDLTDMAAAAGYKGYDCFNNQAIAWAGYLNSITEQPQVGGVFYNKDCFAAAGIEAEPTTWAEFLDVCAKLKDAGIAPLAQDGAYTNFTFYYHLVRYLGEDGIAELRDNGGWAANEKAVQAAQDIIDLRNAGYLADGAPDEYPSSQNKLGTGEAAMVVCANYVTAEVNAAMGEVNWGLFNYPAVDGGAEPTAAYAGANSLAISSYSEHPQEAFDFIMFLVTGEYDQKMADTAAQIPADPSNTAPAALTGTVETLLSADKPMTWCGSLNTHAAWGDMKTLFTELFEGKYATGADFCAAMDALY